MQNLISTVALSLYLAIVPNIHQSCADDLSDGLKRTTEARRLFQIDLSNPDAYHVMNISCAKDPQAGSTAFLLENRTGGLRKMILTYEGDRLSRYRLESSSVLKESFTVEREETSGETLSRAETAFTGYKRLACEQGAEGREKTESLIRNSRWVINTERAQWRDVARTCPVKAGGGFLEIIRRNLNAEFTRTRIFYNHDQPERITVEQAPPRGTLAPWKDIVRFDALKYEDLEGFDQVVKDAELAKQSCDGDPKEYLRALESNGLLIKWRTLP